MSNVELATSQLEFAKKFFPSLVEKAEMILGHFLEDEGREMEAVFQDYSDRREFEATF